ncbi:NAD(P)/FAD-dependent oxidoreductase [Silvanigrella aquatica]|uniref:Flavoprotein n=1 Tax=Silvanigrella aquatica TaxID=1915309 RepID=A0A1L4CXQ6_9BACT|nr:NAD(P)/FAD-dependent oxidoreductase [Silvanigrella aquatica]APJ02728.1 hypothetical protein AXG55_01820 [Silvanigrella aquatica]
MDEWDFIIVGGGAAGFFGAIACAENCSHARVLILEATPRILTKVKISGGGRCNVTHHQFDPKQLVRFYPRGQKELLGPFHKFQPKDTVNWFAEHGVELKVEEDGRMFPITNDSQTVINCLYDAAKNSGVTLRKNAMVQNISQTNSEFDITLKNSETLKAKYVLLATGSMPFGVKLAADLGHKLVSPVPSLFTFKMNHSLLQGLAGISFTQIRISLNFANNSFEYSQAGPCLVTHWGLSGPAVLKLSAFAARELHDSQYKANLNINWIYPLKTEQAIQKLEYCKCKSPKKKIINENPFSCVRRFWEAVLRECGIDENDLFAELTKKKLQDIANLLTNSNMLLMGKGEFKDEFVTAGGVAREEIDFRMMESKLTKGLFFAGEIIDVDGVTGGFNFQNAWTGAWLAGNTIATRLKELEN